MRRMILFSVVVLMAAACLPQSPSAPASGGASQAPANAGSSPAPAVTQAGSGTAPAQPNATPTPTEGPISGGVGDTLTTPIWSLMLEKVERPGRVLEWSNPAGRLDAKGEILLVTLQVRNISRTSASLTPRSFDLNSKDGSSYNPLTCCVPYLTAKSERSLLFATEFPAGVSGRMTLVFDVDPKDSGFALVFVDSKGKFWRLP